MLNQARPVMFTQSQFDDAVYGRTRSSDLSDAAAAEVRVQLNGQLADREWAGSKSRCIAAKAHLFSEGDAKTHIFQVVSGGLCLYRMLEDGRRQVIDFAFDGDIVGLGSGRLATCNAQALAATCANCLPIAVMLTAAKANARIALGLYEALSRELAVSHQHLRCVGQRGASERLATFLLMLSGRNVKRGQPPDTIRLLMARADIADFLGITIETVSRTLTRLKQLGLIEIEEITTLHLRNVAGLVALAEGGARV